MQIAGIASPMIRTTGAALVIGRDLLLDVISTRREGLGVRDLFIAATVSQANLQGPAAAPEVQLAYAASDEVIPESLRRPISISAIARSLDWPFETVRRHVGGLQRSGVLKILPDGVVIDVEHARGPSRRELMLAADALLTRALRRLRDAGWLGQVEWPKVQHQAPLRPFRLSTFLIEDYLLAIAAEGSRLVGGELDFLILIQLARANTAAIDAGRTAAEIATHLIPDDARRPVSVVEVARALDLPRETARRRLLHLEKTGRVARSEAGYIVPGAVIAETAAALAPANDQLLRRLVRACAQYGLLPD